MLANDRYRRHRLKIVDLLLAGGIFVGVFWLLMSTMDMGFTRDEGYYFHAAEKYQAWFGEWEENRAAGRGRASFTQENIDHHWGSNPEHPVLLKTLFGMSWNAFAVDRDWLSPTSAMRLPTAALSALLPALLFLFMVEAFGSRIAGLFAGAALIFQPRYFFHSHLACFDAGISTMWFAVTYAYWKSYHSRTWAWLTGVLFGLALITKLNAFFLPFTLLLHWMIAGWREFRIVRPDGRRRITIPKIPAAFVTMAVLGPFIFYLGWPRHWFDTYNRIAWYIGRHWHHEHYFVYQFGEALVRPPFDWSFPLVMTLITVPVVALATAFAGGSALGREGWRKLTDRGDSVARDRRGTGALIAINLIIPILIIARPETPIFGGTKHWMHAMPWLAALAGVGLMAAFSLLWKARPDGRQRFQRGFAALIFAAILAIPMVHATMSYHPNGTAYYNELVGGARGAADRELMRQFWGYSTRSGLAYLNEIAPDGARVFPHNANADSMRWYQEDGLLRDDFRDHWSANYADYAFFNHQKAFVPVMQEIWEAMETTAPMRVWTVHGVPVLSLYGDPTHRVPEAEDL